MKTLTTIGIDGREHLFEYSFHEIGSDGDVKIEFRVNFAIETDKSKWFDFKLALINDQTLKVTDMFKGKNEHLRTGLPEALILLSKKTFQKKIISSSNKIKTQKCEWRSEPGTKVWQRLVKKNLAEYNSELDTFELK